MRKIRIAVFVSGGGTNLQALLDAQQAGKLPSGEIALVVASRSDAYALTRAADRGIPSEVVRRKDFEDQAAYEASCRKLAASFVENFKKYTRMSAEVVAAGPKA